MKLVLWIDEKELNIKLFEKIFKQANINFYGLSSVDDFSYLINDLTPSVVVIDSKTVLKNLERFKVQFFETEKFHHAHLVIIDQKPELDFLGEKILNLKTPINPFEIVERIQKYLSSVENNFH